VSVHSEVKWKLSAIRGNISLWAFGMGVVLFKAWLWHFHFPESAEISVIFGGLLVPVSQAAAVVNFVLGWLVAVYSLKNVQKIFVHFFRPLELVDSIETKEFLSATATTIVSLFFAGFVIDLATANVAVRIGSRYELVALLPRGSDAFLYDDSGTRGEKFTISAGGAIHIALRGRAAHEVLLLRDQYNLLTLDALGLDRDRGLVRASSPFLRFEGEGDPRSVDEMAGGPHRRGIFDFEVAGPLRYSPRKLNIDIQIAQGFLMKGGYLRPGEEAPCPERTPVAYATQFFADLCRNRNEIGTWTDRASYRKGEDASVSHAIGNYSIEIHFRRGIVILKDHEPFYSREATKLFAREAPPEKRASA